MEGFLDEEEFCALYDVNSTDYPVFEHGKYRRFDLNEVSEEECFSRFRFSDKVIPWSYFASTGKICMRKSNSGLYRGRAVYSSPIKFNTTTTLDKEVSILY